MKEKRTALIVLDFIGCEGVTRISQELTRVAIDYDFIILGGKLEEPVRPESEFRSKRIISYEVKQASNLLGYLLTIARTFQIFSKIIKEEKIDNIILNTIPSGLGIILNPKSFRYKKIFFYHGSWDLEKSSVFNFFRQYSGDKAKFELGLLLFRAKRCLEFRIQKMIMESCSKIFAFSKYSYRQVLNHYGLSKKKIIYSPPPFKIENSLKSSGIRALKQLKIRHGCDENELIFLVPSRLEPRKGIHILIEAIRLIEKREKRKFRVLVIGQNFYPDYAYILFNKCREYGLFSRINFFKTVNRNELYDFYQIADCTILPSVDLETFGLVTVESLFFGTPVIGFNNGATPEILWKVDKRLIVRKIEPNSMAKKIVWFLNLNLDEKKRLRNKSQKAYFRIIDNSHFLKKLKSELG